MASWEPGRSAVEYLIRTARLERLAGDVASAADVVLGRAARRLTTAQAGLRGGDVDGAFVAAYDAYRMAAESLLVRQGLRATGGEGSHVTVEDSVSAQFSAEIPAFAKPTFERFRRTRHAAQYFDPNAPDITVDDTTWAISTAGSAVDGTRQLSERKPPPLFDPPAGS